MNRRNFLLVCTCLPLVKDIGASNSTVGGVIKLPYVPPLKSVDLSLLLHCIAQVETGGNDRKVGPCGERSKYQITYDVWHDITGLGHRNFLNHCRDNVAADCAMRHVQWLDKTIPRISDIERNFREFAIAWAWHGGASSWTASGQNTTRALNNYAVRVTNLYGELSRV